MKSRLALMPLLIMSAFSYAAEETAATTAANAQQTELQQVEVRADAKRVKAARSYSIASDGDLRDRVNLGLLGKANAFTAPITVVNYDEKVLENNASRTLVDTIAKNDASTMQFGGESNTIQGVYVRGLQLDARQFSINGLAGLYSYYHTPTAGVSSAQLIKGASSSTVGMDPEGAAGSSVNIETKKASDEGNRKIGLAVFSKNRTEGAIDIGQRFGENKQFGIRFNGKYRKGETARKGYKEDNQEFALNTDYRGEKLRLSFDSMYNHRNTEGGRARIHEMQDLNFAMPAAPSGKTLLVPSWQEQTTKTMTNALTFEYDTDYNMQISGGLGYMESVYKGSFTQLLMKNRAKGGNLGNYTAQAAQPFEFLSRTTSGNLKARGEFETGPVVHNWATSFDYIKRHRDHDQGTRNGDALDTNIYNPVFPITHRNNPANIQGTEHTTYETPSLAISDTLGFADNTIRLTLGGRYQWVKQTAHPNLTGNAKTDANRRSSTVKFSKKRFSPMFAAAWVPNTGMVVYGNYMQDLEPGATNEDTGEMSKPRVSKQIEMGVRKNWGDVVTSLNAFQIVRPGYWRNTQEQHGKEINRGVEFNTYANLMNKTLRPSFGIMYLKAQLKDYPRYNNTLTNGNQVASPRVIAKAGIEWDTPFVQGLTLKSNIQYYGKSFQDTERQYKLPSYTLVDVGARYKTKLGKNTLTVSSSVENLFNKNYWQVQRGQYDRSFAVVGMPRTYWLKAELDF